MKRKKDKNLKVFATDLRRWCYCPRQWWYHRVLGRRIKVTKAMKQGLQHHKRVGEKIEEIAREQKQFRFNFIAGGIICLVLLLLYLASLPS